MTRPQRFAFVLRYFQTNFPEPQTELVYRSAYELLVSTVLAAQCTDKRVNHITPPLFDRYPDAIALAQGNIEEIFAFIRSVSYPNNKAKHLLGLGRLLVDEYEGQVPARLEDLIRLPGVGRKTANVVLSVIFNQPAMAVDTHVFRVSRRIGLVSSTAKTPLTVELGLVKYIPEDLVNRAHHWLILHGRYICLARTPKCSICPLLPACRYGSNFQTKWGWLPDSA